MIVLPDIPGVLLDQNVNGLLMLLYSVASQFPDRSMSEIRHSSK
jgi:hypothetical protein